MYNVFINGKPVNQFESEQEAYGFAVAIKSGDTTEVFNPESDSITFEGEGCVQTIQEFESDL